jgi:hypothetical protein
MPGRRAEEDGDMAEGRPTILVVEDEDAAIDPAAL